MSRNSRTRRLARKARAPSRRFDPPEPSGTWGSATRAPFTPNERANMLARFRDMRGPGGVQFGFLPLIDTWLEAKTPEELDEAVRQKLLADAERKLRS